MHVYVTKDGEGREGGLESRKSATRWVSPFSKKRRQFESLSYANPGGTLAMRTPATQIGRSPYYYHYYSHDLCCC